jgi:hypothetical protein
MSTIKAQKESEQLRAVVKAEVRKRKNWAVIHPLALDELGASQQKLGLFPGDVIPARDVLIRRHFGTPLDAEVRTADNGALMAVWTKEGKVTEEPEFVRDPAPAPIEFAVLTPEPVGWWGRLLGRKPKPPPQLGAAPVQGPVSLERGGYGMGDGDES